MPYFNPRPRKEGDLGVEGNTGYSYDFNPRPRKEGDGKMLDNYVTVEDFNPRPRKEGDDTGIRDTSLYFRFQSTPS